MTQKEANHHQKEIKKLTQELATERIKTAIIKRGYLDLLGQVEQAREGFGIYHDSPSMASAIENARSILLPNSE